MDKVEKFKEIINRLSSIASHQCTTCDTSLYDYIEELEEELKMYEEALNESIQQEEEA